MFLFSVKGTENLFALNECSSTPIFITTMFLCIVHCISSFEKALTLTNRRASIVCVEHLLFNVIDYIVTIVSLGRMLTP